MYNTIFDEFYRINKELNKYFGVTRGHRQYLPEFNVYENQNEYMVVGKIPGVDKNDVSITFKDNSLKVNGEKKIETKENYNYHLQERKSGKFERNFLLNDKVEADKIGAEIKNGLLVIKIPKSPETKPYKIEIK